MHIKQYFWKLIYKMHFYIYYQYGVNSVNNKSRERVAIGHKEISHFWDMKICDSGAPARFARFARSRVLAYKWVKSSLYYRYNQSNVNNGSNRPRSSPYRNITLWDNMKIIILFLIPRRSLAHISTIYSHRFFILLITTLFRMSRVCVRAKNLSARLRSSPHSSERIYATIRLYT